MYKNFKISDEEKKQIMEMHKIRGYKKPMNEDESPMMGVSDDNVKSSINKIMDLAYEVIQQEAPNGPRDVEQYMSAINKLQSDFDYTIRNLKGNVRGGEDKDIPGFEGTMDQLNDLGI